MQVSVNRHSHVPAYTQIENQLIFAMATGVLKPGNNLPSLKELARQGRIHVKSAVKVYENLKAMGLIYSLKGQGSFVKERAGEKAHQRCHTEIVKTLHQTAQEARAAGMTKNELEDIISAILETGSFPYEDIADSILALAKKN